MIEEVTPKKSLGQNFLKNQITINLIDDILDIKEHDKVIEIGPGTGAITDNILSKTKNYIGIEKDRKLSEKLLKKYKSEVRILNQDVLDSDFSKLFDKNIRLVGNIPYNISTQIITKCILERENIISAHFMMQKEFVDRIQSNFGSKIFGRLSVYCQVFFNVNKYIDIPADDFYPKPKVESSFFSLVPKSKIILRDDEIKGFLKFVKEIFNTRRKKIKNCIEIKNHNMYVNIEKRAEQLSIIDMVNLYRELKNDGSFI